MKTPSALGLSGLLLMVAPLASAAKSNAPQRLTYASATSSVSAQPRLKPGQKKFLIYTPRNLILARVGNPNGKLAYQLTRSGKSRIYALSAGFYMAFKNRVKASADGAFQVLRPGQHSH